MEVFKQLSELKVLLHLAAPLGAESSAQGRVASYCSQGTGLIFSHGGILFYLGL